MQDLSSEAGKTNSERRTGIDLKNKLTVDSLSSNILEPQASWNMSVGVMQSLTRLQQMIIRKIYYILSEGKILVSRDSRHTRTLPCEDQRRHTSLKVLLRQIQELLLH